MGPAAYSCKDESKDHPRNISSLFLGGLTEEMLGKWKWEERRVTIQYQWRGVGKQEGGKEKKLIELSGECREHSISSP